MPNVSVEKLQDKIKTREVMSDGSGNKSSQNISIHGEFHQTSNKTKIFSEEMKM